MSLERIGTETAAVNRNDYYEDHRRYLVDEVSRRVEPRTEVHQRNIYRDNFRKVGEYSSAPAIMYNPNSTARLVSTDTYPRASTYQPVVTSVVSSPVATPTMSITGYY